MPAISMTGSIGSAWISRTASAKGRSPPSAFALVQRCSTRNTPTGMTPDSEWSLRRRNARECVILKRAAPMTPWFSIPSKRRLAVVALALGLACGHSASEAPVAPLASSTYAADLFDHVREAWNDPTAAGRDRLRRMLTEFLAAYPNDGLVPLGRMYLALSLMEGPADWPRAQALMAQVGTEPPPGTVRDLYLIARARTMRHENQPDKAFELLRPLVGKMVDPVARGMLEEEVTLAAVEAHHDYEAVAYMDAWLRGATPDEHERARTKIQKILQGMPEGV